MKIISLFFPAMISIGIRHLRNKDLSWQMSRILVEYGICTLIVTFLSACVVTYILRIPDVLDEALGSFSFFTKYLGVAMIMAVLLPYAEELIRKHVEISFRVERMTNEK